MTSSYAGPELKVLRRRAMLTQKQAAKLAGINEGTLINMEQGATNPHIATISKVLTLYEEEIAKVEARFKKLYSKTRVRHAPVGAK